MARLKIRRGGKEIAEIPLSEERQYLAGRKDGCDILLTGEKGISREHFRLYFVNGFWTVETLSRFGEVFLAGEKVATLGLEHGMVFSVPPFEFEFLMTTADVPTPVTPEASEEGEVAESEAGAAPASDVIEKTYVGVAPSVPYIKVMDRQGEARELIRLEGGDSYIAGRDSSCNIHIKDSRVSRRQFEIRRNGTNYSIIDLGSVNGTLVNGNPISTTEPTPLRSGDAISVLENYLYFELHDPNFKSRLELVQLQPLPDVMSPALPENHLPMALPPDGSQAPIPYSHHGAPVAWAPQPGGYPVAAPPPPPAGLAGKWQSMDRTQKMRVSLIGLIVVIGLGYVLSGGEDANTPQSLGPMINDPFAKLSPEQKKLVKDTLQLAKSYYMQGKYEFARSELVKMQEIVPTYEDSDGLMKLVNEAINVQQLQRKQEELERARAEHEDKIQRKVAECRKLLNPEVTREQLEMCVVEVVPFNPSHPLFAELYAEGDRLVAERRAREAMEAEHRSRVERLRGMHSRARSLENSKPLDAIAAYERVIASELPDPGGLKSASRGRVAELRRQVNQKTKVYQDEAEAFSRDGKLKEAILSLRKAKKVDPKNPDLDTKIDSLKARLQEQMMVIYQEGILEESFGNVEADPNKGNDGAKKKWRTILERDVTDGEYYKKAYIKLKKYGAHK